MDSVAQLLAWVEAETEGGAKPAIKTFTRLRGGDAGAAEDHDHGNADGHMAPAVKRAHTHATKAANHISKMGKEHLAHIARLTHRASAGAVYMTNLASAIEHWMERNGHRHNSVLTRRAAQHNAHVDLFSKLMDSLCQNKSGQKTIIAKANRHAQTHAAHEARAHKVMLDYLGAYNSKTKVLSVKFPVSKPLAVGTHLFGHRSVAKVLNKGQEYVLEDMPLKDVPDWGSNPLKTLETVAEQVRLLPALRSIANVLWRLLSLVPGATGLVEWMVSNLCLILPVAGMIGVGLYAFLASKTAFEYDFVSAYRGETAGLSDLLAKTIMFITSFLMLHYSATYKDSKTNKWIRRLAPLVAGVSAVSGFMHSSTERLESKATDAIGEGMKKIQDAPGRLVGRVKRAARGPPSLENGVITSLDQMMATHARGSLEYYHNLHQFALESVQHAVRGGTPIIDAGAESIWTVPQLSDAVEAIHGAGSLSLNEEGHTPSATTIVPLVPSEGSQISTMELTPSMERASMRFMQDPERFAETWVATMQSNGFLPSRNLAIYHLDMMKADGVKRRDAIHAAYVTREFVDGLDEFFGTIKSGAGQVIAGSAQYASINLAKVVRSSVCLSIVDRVLSGGAAVEGISTAAGVAVGGTGVLALLSTPGILSSATTASGTTLSVVTAGAGGGALTTAVTAGAAALGAVVVPVSIAVGVAVYLLEEPDLGEHGLLPEEEFAEVLKDVFVKFAEWFLETCEEGGSCYPTSDDFRTFIEKGGNRENAQAINVLGAWLSGREQNDEVRYLSFAGIDGEGDEV